MVSSLPLVTGKCRVHFLKGCYEYFLANIEDTNEECMNFKLGLPTVYNI